MFVFIWGSYLNSNYFIWFFWKSAVGSVCKRSDFECPVKYGVVYAITNLIPLLTCSSLLYLPSPFYLPLVCSGCMTFCFLWALFKKVMTLFFLSFLLLLYFIASALECICLHFQTTLWLALIHEIALLIGLAPISWAQWAALWTIGTEWNGLYRYTISTLRPPHTIMHACSFMHDSQTRRSLVLATHCHSWVHIHQLARVTQPVKMSRKAACVAIRLAL